MIISDVLMTFPHQMNRLSVPSPTVIHTTEKASVSRCSELCSVCGDQSTGYHYEVPSCNGCKTFFRRTIVSERTFKCHKNGRCEFTKDIRCACRACRFKKCLDVGMNPKAIQTSRPGFPSKEASPSTSTSPEPNKDLIRKRAYDISSLLDIPSCSTANLLCSNSNSSTSRSTTPTETHAKWRNVDQTNMNLLADLQNLEDRVEFLRKSTFLPSQSILDLLTRPCSLDDLSKYEPSPLFFVTADVDLEKETSLAIEYVKSFDWFKDMAFSDKYALLCDRTLLLVTFRQIYRRSISTNNMKDGFSSVLEGGISALNRMDIDRTTFSLLHILLLLDSDSFAMSPEAKAQLVSMKQKYMDCLGAHLFQKYGSRGASMMTERFSLLWSLLNISSNLRQILQKTLPECSLTKQIINITGLI